jgi:lipopolysaccharide biosynthesis glycosyltransferase
MARWRDRAAERVRASFPDRGVLDRETWQPLRATRRSLREQVQRDGRLARHLSRLARVGGQPSSASSHRSPGRLRRAEARLRRAEARATLVSQMLATADIDSAVCATARAMGDAGEKARTVQVLGSVSAELGASADAVNLVQALAASMWQPPRWTLADHCLQQVGRRSLVYAHAASQAVRAAQHTGRLDAVDEVIAQAGSCRPDDLVAIGESLLANVDRGRLDSVLDEISTRELGRGLAVRARTLRAWADRWTAGEATRGATSLAVLTPEGPDPATRASTGRHLALAAVLAAAAEAAPHEPVIHVPQHFPAAHVPPPGSWLLVTNDAAPRLFATRLSLPLFPGVRPLFLGWSPGSGGALTPPVLAALKAAEPIGCADWSGVDLLLGAGIVAFRSGPASAMLDERFVHARRDTDAAAAPDSEVVGEPSQSRPVTHPLSQRMSNAQDLLGDVASARTVRTADVDLAAAIVAVGGRVRPNAQPPGDPSWDGLADLKSRPASHRALGRRLRHALVVTLRQAVAGAEDQDVYRTWAEQWVDDIAQARLRQSPLPAVAPAFSVDKAVRDVRSGRRLVGPHDARLGEVHVAMASDANLLDQVPVAIEAVVANASRPVTVWMLCRGFERAYQDRLGQAFPQTRLMFLPCDGVTYPRARLLGHITPSTMDRLLLPELVTDVDRIVYLDIDALVLDDIATLADLDLEGHPLAARGTFDFPQTRLFASIRRRSQQLPAHIATELRRRMHMRHPRDLYGFNAGVLVMDLGRMRLDRFCQTYLGWPTRYGLHDQELLIYAFGDDRAELPERWNMWPAHEPVLDPAVLHWLGPYKPWKPIRVPEQDRWRSVEEGLRSRLHTADMDVDER